MYYTRKNYYQMKDDKEYKVYVIRPILDDEEYAKKNKFNYYGLTIKHIDERYGKHKSNFKSNTKMCKSYMVFEKYGIDNCECVILNRFDNEFDMIKQEILYINHNENCVNSVYKHSFIDKTYSGGIKFVKSLDYETIEETITRQNKEKEKELIKLNKIKEQQIKENNLIEKERKIIKRKQIKKQKRKEEKEANKTMNKRFCK